MNKEMEIVFDLVTFSFHKSLPTYSVFISLSLTCNSLTEGAGPYCEASKAKKCWLFTPSSVLIDSQEVETITTDHEWFFSRFNVSPLLCSIWVLHFIFKIEMSLHETMLRMSIVIKYALLHEFLWLLNTLCCLCLYIFPFFLQSLVDNTYSAKSEEVSYNK